MIFSNMEKQITSVEEWLETDDKMCVDVTNNKYFFTYPDTEKKETIVEFLKRVVQDPNSGLIRQDFLEMVSDLIFIPAGRILANRGLWKYGIKVTYNNCYVLEGPEDNIESIYEVAKKMARTFSYGGGVGIDISKLAPKNAKVNNSAQKSTGAVSFCETYSNVSTTIGQKGRR